MLVLLPGLDGTGDLFAPVVDALGPNVPTQIVRYPLSHASDYAACEAIARGALPTDRPYVLLGESFSGPIAVSIAAAAPPGLRGLILCSTFARNPQPYLRPLRPLLSILPVHSAPLWVSRFLILGKFATPALRKLHQQTLAHLPPTTVRERLRAILECDVSVALTNVRVPVLCLTAKHDRLIPSAAAHLIHHHVPAATIVEIDAPHFLLQCRPSDAADAIRMFLQQFDPGHGDYTADRDHIVGNPSVDDLMGELEQRRQSPSGK
jgi:pimeloyl-ACP methyl ester carboxylesterase